MNEVLKGRRFQFSLKSLFIATAMVAGIVWIIAWGFPVLLDRIDGWPKPISGIQFDNRSHSTVRDVQIINDVGTVLWDSNSFWGDNATGRRVSHGVGGSKLWESPSTRPLVGRRLTVNWTDMNGKPCTAKLRLTELDAGGGVYVSMEPGGAIAGNGGFAMPQRQH